MITPSTPNDFYAAPSAISITLNALGDPDNIAVSVYAGAKVTAYHKGIIDYTPANEYPVWTIYAFNTHFADTAPRYMHLAIQRNGDAATIVYPNTLLDLEGRPITDDQSSYILDDGTILPDPDATPSVSIDQVDSPSPATQSVSIDQVDSPSPATTPSVSIDQVDSPTTVSDASPSDQIPSPDPDYYYLFLAKISSSEGNQYRTLLDLNNGQLSTPTSGNLDTAQYRNEEQKGLLAKMFEYIESSIENRALPAIRQLLPIISSHIFTLRIGSGDDNQGKPITDLHRSTDPSPDFPSVSIDQVDSPTTVPEASPSTLDQTIPSLAYLHQHSEQYSLSKTHDDTAAGNITFAKDISVLGDSTLHDTTVYGTTTHTGNVSSTQFSQGDIPTIGTGWRITPDGKMVADSLTLRESLTVPELRYNRVTTFHGIQWHTVGSNKIKSVTIAPVSEVFPSDPTDPTYYDGIIELDLEDGEFGSLKEGDKCMGIWHMTDGTSNETEDLDDHHGNFHFAGFKTIYFLITEAIDSNSNNARFKYILRATDESATVTDASPSDTPWTDRTHPQPEMHVAAYANAIYADRQQSSYETTTYKIQLVGMTAWTFTSDNIIKIDGCLDGFSINTIYYEDGQSKSYTLNLEGWGIACGNMYYWGSMKGVTRDNILVSQQLYFLATSDSLDEVLNHYTGWTDDEGTHAPDLLTHYAWSKHPVKTSESAIHLYEFWRKTYANGEYTDDEPFYVSTYTSSPVTLKFQHDLVPIFCKNKTWGDNITSEADAYIYALYDTDIENEVTLFVGDTQQPITAATVTIDYSGQPNAYVDGELIPENILSAISFSNGKIHLSIIGGAFRIDENVTVTIAATYTYDGQERTVLGSFSLVPNYEGAEGNPGNSGISVLTSFVFLRSPNVPATPSGGTFSNPIPTGWYDSVPAGDDLIWMSKRLFYSDNSVQTEWSTPMKMVDSVDFEVIYSDKPSPATPTSHPFDPTIDTDWIDDVTTEEVIFMATSRQSNATWSQWNIAKIKGEKGEKGDKGNDGSNGNSYLGTGEFYYATITEDESLPSHTIDNHTQWYNAVPSDYSANKPYLWNFEIVSYTQSDGTVIRTATTPQMISYWGQSGDNGRSIGDIQERYFATADGDDPPTDSTEGMTDSTAAGFSRLKPNLYNRSIVLDTDGEEISRTPWHLISHWGETGVSAISCDLSNEVDTVGIGADGILDSDVTLSTAITLYVGITPQPIDTISTELIDAYTDIPVTITPIVSSSDSSSSDSSSPDSPSIVSSDASLPSTSSADSPSPDSPSIVSSDASLPSTLSILLHSGIDSSLLATPDRFVIRITVTSGEISATKDLTIFFSREAEDGTVYRLSPSADTITVSKDSDNNSTYSTTSLSCLRTIVSGSGAPKESSIGYIYYRITHLDATGASVTTDYTPYTSAISVTDDSYLSIEFSWFSSQIEYSSTGSKNPLPTLLDRESIPIVRWGNNGVGSFIADLSNEQDAVGIGSDSILDVDTPILTTYSLYYGADLQSLSSLAYTIDGIGSNPTSLVSVSPNKSTGLVTITIKKYFDFSKCLSHRFSVNISGQCDGLTAPITKSISIIGDPTSEDGEIRYVKPSVSSVVVSKDAAGNDVYSVQNVTCLTFKKVGSNTPSQIVDGYLYYRITSLDANSASVTTDYIPYTSAISITDVSYISVEFSWFSSQIEYSSTGSKNPIPTLIDRESIPIVRWGKKGDKGDKGERGASVKLNGSYDTLALLQSAKAKGEISPSDGDGWSVKADGHIWVWSAEANAFVDGGKMQGDSAYVHVAWCNTPDNSDNSFSISKPDGQEYAYMGTRTDSDPNDSPRFSDYDWVYIKGDKGDTGAQGDKGDKGDPGENAFILDIDNEMTSIPVTSDSQTSKIITLSFGINTFYGSRDVTADTSITLTDVTPSPTLPSSSSQNFSDFVVISNGTVTITIPSGTQMPEITELTFTAVHATYGTRTAVFSIAAVKSGGQGQDAELQELLPSLSQISFTRGVDGATLTPSSRFLSCKIKKTKGNQVSEQTITESGLSVRCDTTSMPTSKSSGEPFTDSGQTISSGTSATNFYIAAFNASGVLVDRETIPIIKDGAKGEEGEKGEQGDKGDKGDPGQDAYSFDISNEMDSVPANYLGTVTSTTISTGLSFFKGVTPKNIYDGSTAVTSSLTGAIVSYSAEGGTMSSASILESNFSATITAMTSDKMTITFTATYYESGVHIATKSAVMTINRIKAAKDGTSPIIYQLKPSHNVIHCDKDYNFTPASSGLTCAVTKRTGATEETLTSLPSGYKTSVIRSGTDETEREISYNSPIGFLVNTDERKKAFTGVTIFLKKGDTIIDKETIPVVRDGDDGKDPIIMAAMMPNVSIPLDAGNKPIIEVDEDHSTFSVYFYATIGDKKTNYFNSLSATRVAGTSNGVTYYDFTEDQGSIEFHIDKTTPVDCFYWEFEIKGEPVYNGVVLEIQSCRVSFAAISAGVSAQGTQGIQGCVVRYRGEWKSSEAYVNQSSSNVASDATGVRYIDVVSIGAGTGNILFYSRTQETEGYTPNANNEYPEPGTTAGTRYWTNGSYQDFIASKVSWTENQWATNLSGKTLIVCNDDDKTSVVGGIQSVKESSNNSHTMPMIWAGNVVNNAQESQFRVYQDGQCVAKQFKTADSGTRVEIKDGLMSVFGLFDQPNIEFGIDDNGYAILKYYDHNHNLLYNLGPEGIVHATTVVFASYSNVYAKLLSSTSAYTLPTKIQSTNLTLETKYRFMDGTKRIGSVNYYSSSFSDSGWKASHSDYHSRVYIQGGTKSPSSNTRIPDGWYLGERTYDNPSSGVFGVIVYNASDGILAMQCTLYLKSISNTEYSPCKQDGSFVNSGLTFEQYIAATNQSLSQS